MRDLFKLRGMTLIELLVAMSVVGVLSGAIFFADPLKWQGKGRDAQRKADLIQIQSALESYNQVNGDYPGTINWCKMISAAGDTTVKSALVTSFLKRLPRDPKTSATTDYMYWHNAAREYRLYAVLENTSDPLHVAGVINVDGGSGTCTGYSVNYDYKVTNP